ncbi:hypothetical protein HNE_1391 [Hyphomonas neptunium ATCC 15444]|uniref:Uncharacterized protein n=2 Tax=Hyphomonas TaxID=85 RepID=Q0C2D5_HYPNA|nr:MULTISPECIES: hypothetical protein [Hyphomonas]ABI78752.1 hypothetical protein HNE_1391 [Hyphomonas neptunium ATCC 15444]KCZ93178.1 hypothetical protein HHI_10854 [Hyphomonas hirschiana VP5]
MAFTHAAIATDTGRAIRLAALAVVFLALSLGVWRASSLLTGGADSPRSPAEASLSTLIDPIAGPGNARTSVAFNAEGGRTVFVLLDAPAAPVAGDLQRILPEAAGLDFTRGDKLIIEQAAFARGLPGRPDTAAWLELGALGLISFISAGMALATLRRSPVPAIPAPVREPERAHSGPRSDILRPSRPVMPAPVAEAGDVAKRDPVRSAAVLRGWMTGGEDAS